MSKSLEFLCSEPVSLSVWNGILTVLGMVSSLYLLSTPTLALFAKRVGRPISKAVYRDVVLFEVVIVVQAIWYVFFLSEENLRANEPPSDTLSTHFTAM